MVSQAEAANKIGFSFVVKHTFFMLLHFIGLRDRLRCPKCKAVGTWKPHGGFFGGARTAQHRGQIINVRMTMRWLCKYCGHYVGPEGVKRCVPSRAKGWWVFDNEPDADQETPLKVVKDQLDAWPWKG